jgi:hypothetical protein
MLWEGPVDIASVFEWFAQETANIAEQANELRRRETLGKLALLWAAAAAQQRDNRRLTAVELVRTRAQIFSEKKPLRDTEPHSCAGQQRRNIVDVAHQTGGLSL